MTECGNEFPVVKNCFEVNTSLLGLSLKTSAIMDVYLSSVGDARFQECDIESTAGEPPAITFRLPGDEALIRPKSQQMFQIAPLSKSMSRVEWKCEAPGSGRVTFWKPAFCALKTHHIRANSSYIHNRWAQFDLFMFLSHWMSWLLHFYQLLLINFSDWFGVIRSVRPFIIIRLIRLVIKFKLPKARIEQLLKFVFVVEISAYSAL
ncbi:hypothetical protein ANCDUO_01764 [Ancylostoma duodenale]|uniref:Uncharacterized protein n=1 Tax=Ancylostoma duodenale TaxID=51022 RepID=A0A0C2HED9_9BILA|nr:hypothetical protein ANCDUO_01764 [Ancylostoma duodenale]